MDLNEAERVVKETAILETPKVVASLKQLQILRYIGLAIGLLGVCLLAWNAGWLVALAVFLMFWGNNITQASDIGGSIIKLTAKLMSHIH